MRFSQSCACNFVPLMARIVLAIAFIPAGWAKLMSESDFTGPQAHRLQELGIAALPSATPTDVVPASYQDDDSATSTDPADDGIEPPDDSVDEPMDPDLTVKARTLHHITLMMDGRVPDKWLSPLAWLAACTEFFGGILLLIGLFSRIWALGLATTMVVAFALTSLQPVLDTWVFGMTPDQSMKFMVQLALFALAFGVFLTGPGVVSLDHRIFRRKHDTVVESNSEYDEVS